MTVTGGKPLDGDYWMSSSWRRRKLQRRSTPEIDIGTFINSALILVSPDIEGFHFDVNGIFSEPTQGVLRRRQFGQTLSISHSLEPLTIAGELWHFTQPLTNGNAVGNLWAVSYSVDYE